MTFIFKDILKKGAVKEILSQYNVFKKLFSFIKNNRIPMKICSLCLIGMLAVGISVVAVGITLGFKVNYAGSFIATVRNSSVFDDAKDIAVNHISSSNADGAIKRPSFKMTLTVEDRLDSALKVADAIIENTDDIEEAAELRVNGVAAVCAARDELTSYLEYCRNRFNIEGAENVSEFTDSIEIENGYYLRSELANETEMKAVIEALPVKTTATVTSEEAIPFSSKTEKTSTELIGYSKVTTAGENGLKRKTEVRELINGEKQSAAELSSEVVKEPVTQITLVGTAKTTASAKQRSAARSAGLICPLDKSSFVISAYYGDGRGHKGMDLAANKGTPIYAAASGTVTLAKFDGAYGNCVVIDHGNGIKTRYGHASVLKVSAGDKVEQGDVIALVGCTGNSSGNHLHIEVMINGNRVNPASYIGLD